MVPALTKAKQDGYESGFLREWKQRWANHKLVVTGLSKLFMYLDRFYTPNTDGIFSLKEQGFKQYKEHVFDSFHLQARHCILSAIERERGNEQQDRHLLQEAVTVYVEIGYQYANKKLDVYKQELEKAVIAHAGVYYQRKSREWMDQDSAPVYMEKGHSATALTPPPCLPPLPAFVSLILCMIFSSAPVPMQSASTNTCALHSLAHIDRTYRRSHAVGISCPPCHAQCPSLQSQTAAPSTCAPVHSFLSFEAARSLFPISCAVLPLQVEKMLASERNRVEAYLNRSTLEPLHRECYIQMLKTHQRELLRKKTGIFHLLSIHAIDDLSRMYRLYKGNDSDLEAIAEMLGEHIKKAGTEVVDRSRPQAGQGDKGGDDDETKESKEAKMDDGEEKSKAAADKAGAAPAAAPTMDASADANHALVRNLIALHAQYNEIVSNCESSHLTSRTCTTWPTSSIQSLILCCGGGCALWVCQASRRLR